METRSTGYKQKKYEIPVKRYCQTLDLKDNPELITQYLKCHDKEHFWPEIGTGIRSVGILEMEIYIIGPRLFMIVETPLDFEWEVAFEKLARLPRQAEWEAFVSVFQQAAKDAVSSEKWQLMDRMFHLYDR